MKTILVTGANGFVGKNLSTVLQQMQDMTVLHFDTENTKEELSEYIRQADFVVHLAGINRPKEISEFATGNYELTAELLRLMDESGRRSPILLSSSIQAEQDNPYGKSKKMAEQAVRDWGMENNVPVYLYRLPNLFGKWCRPNYNSVVATFCYNVAHGLPIQVNDPTAILKLAYIDDVVAAIVSAIQGQVQPDMHGYCQLGEVFSISLQELADLLSEIALNRKTLAVPNLESAFTRRLYATYLSYLPDNNFSYPLEMREDNRGWLAEFIKSKQFGQIFISRTKPGITRGNHWHHTKIEKFLVIEGEAVIRLKQIHGDKVVEYPVSGNSLTVVDIPVGYTHSITNTGSGDVITLFWVDEIFDPEKADTVYLEV